MDDPKTEAVARVPARAHGENLGQRGRNLDAIEEMWWPRFKGTAGKAIAALIEQERAL